ncbi:MAG: NIL domain-containing protein [Candidatus Omnitrophica bacterium]|nr:NIL domain-containing protein [Candidatus Omnitrophota bacterium]
MRVRTELNFPSNLKDEPLIWQVCKKFEVVLSIVEASFSTDVGWAILILEGKKEDVEEVLRYLKDKGVEISKIEETG